MESQNFYGNIIEAEAGHSSKGTPQLVIRFNITHRGPNPGETEAVEISPIDARVYVYLSETAWANSEAKLEALGFNFDYANPAFTEGGAWLERRIEDFNGKRTEKWELPSPSGRGAGDPLTADEMRALAARRKKKTPTTRPTPPSPTKAATKPAEEPDHDPGPDGKKPPTGDGIPF